MHAIAGRIYFKTSQLSSWVSKQSSSLDRYSLKGQKQLQWAILSQHQQHSMTKTKVACLLLSVLMVPNWKLGGCSLCIKLVLKEFNSAFLLPFFFFPHGRQIYGIQNTEGKAQQKTSCHIHRIDKNAFGLAFLWLNKQGSKGWNSKTAPWLLAKEIDAKAISQSRTGKSQEQCFFSKQETFHFFKSHYSVVAFCFHSQKTFSLSMFFLIYILIY